MAKLTLVMALSSTIFPVLGVVDARTFAIFLSFLECTTDFVFAQQQLMSMILRRLKNQEKGSVSESELLLELLLDMLMEFPQEILL